ncbi:MAG: hypothetical protein ACLFOA_03575 [Desulfohalobiaceae bacterium]
MIAKLGILIEPPAYFGRGRPAKYGKKLKLKQLFDSKACELKPLTVTIYGGHEPYRSFAWIFGGSL